MGGKESSWRRLIGIEESQTLRVLYVVATLGGLIANYVALVGCMSPSTRSLHMYATSREGLADSLRTLNFGPPSNTTTGLGSAKGPAGLDDSALPDYWFWGMSGVCSYYESEDTALCRHAFPPTFHLQTVIEDSLRERLGDQAENHRNRVLSAWTEMLAGLDPEIYEDKQSKYASQSRGSAALAVLSLLFGTAILGFSVITLFSEEWQTRLPLWLMNLFALADASMFFGAALLATSALFNGPRGLIGSAAEISGVQLERMDTSFTGAGLFVLFAGAAAKFMAVGLIGGTVILLVIFIVFFIIGCCFHDDNKGVVYYVVERRVYI